METKLDKVKFVGQYLATSRSEDQILEMAMVISHDILGYDHAIIRFAEKNLLISRKWVGFPRDSADIKIKIGEGISGAVAQTGKSILVADTTGEPRFITGVVDCRSELCVPIVYDDKVIGIINVESNQRSFFNDEDIRFLETLAFQIGGALETFRLREKLIKTEPLSVVGQMASSILHDVRNDINKLYIVADLIESPDIDDGDKKKIISTLTKAADNIHHLIEGIFGFVKTGQMNYEMKRGNLYSILDSLVRELEIRSKDQAKITLLSDDNIPTQMDETAIQRVFQNLLNNALDSIDKGGKVEIKCDKSDKGFTVTISDNGCGIPSKSLNKIWEPFYTKGKKKGTGLGLAIVKKIIEDHGWQINVKSKEGSGTTFTIHILQVN